jgi:hypothetical protein
MIHANLFLPLWRRTPNGTGVPIKAHRYPTCFFLKMEDKGRRSVRLGLTTRKAFGSEQRKAVTLHQDHRHSDDGSSLAREGRKYMLNTDLTKRRLVVYAARNRPMPEQIASVQVNPPQRSRGKSSGSARWRGVGAQRKESRRPKRMAEDGTADRTNFFHPSESRASST